ncbi:hypothetical protein GF339_21010 [candidate division KSB3 bacterium]|uniref:Uncharacterized protein n=1 Tax=candidate division KSB3 bacterium TaxID=2044937 RepID=A0A9D5JZX1_9BACT|nr:hypothetical protein [candidate division KSB3 bacterium]MBD3327080.1 hypothetical protein [candidate division KSB3 bacterium]
MKNLKKLLQYSQQVEHVQTARKAKEVGEVQNFEAHWQHHKRRDFTQYVGFEQAYTDHLSRTLDELDADEHAHVEHDIQTLAEIEQFEQHAQNDQLRTSGNTFDLIDELQGRRSGQESHAIMQLPAAPPEVFEQEFSDVIDVEFHRELDQNQRQINQEEDPAPASEDENSEDNTDDAPRNVFFFRNQKPQK